MGRSAPQTRAWERPVGERDEGRGPRRGGAAASKDAKKDSGAGEVNVGRQRGNLRVPGRESVTLSPAAPSAPPGKQHRRAPAPAASHGGWTLASAAEGGFPLLPRWLRWEKPPAAEAVGLGLQAWPPSWNRGVKGKPASPSLGQGLILDLAASHSVTQRSPQADSSLLPPSQGRVGGITTKTLALIIMTTSTWYMFSAFQMMYHSAHLICIPSSNRLTALCDRIWVVFAFYS